MAGWQVRSSNLAEIEYSKGTLAGYESSSAHQDLDPKLDANH